MQLNISLSSAPAVKVSQEGFVATIFLDMTVEVLDGDETIPVACISVVLVLLWMTRSITNDVPGWGALFDGKVGDGTVSVMMATFLFVIPNKQNEGEKLMDWNKAKKLPCKIILLLGAGFAIADGVRTSGLNDVLSKNLKFLEAAPYLAMTPLICLISGTLNEFMTNNATTLVVPILIELAQSMKVHPLLLMVPGAIGAQFSFLLPASLLQMWWGLQLGTLRLRVRLVFETNKKV